MNPKTSPTTISIIDTHCHPQFPQYDEDRDAVLRRALDGGVGMICVGTDLHSSRAAIKLAGNYEGVFATVGLHPNDGDEPAGTTAYEDLLDNDRVVAVGEIGLDYFRTTGSDAQENQRGRLAHFLDIAARNDYPVVLHCRDAHRDMLDMLRNSEVRTGVIHSFTGTARDAQQYLELGFHIGLNGIITFTRDYDEAISRIPIERILIETDAPYLTPTPYRGKRNEPLFIEKVAGKLAELKGSEVSAIKHITTDNALRVFSKVYLG